MDRVLLFRCKTTEALPVWKPYDEFLNIRFKNGVYYAANSSLTSSRLFHRMGRTL